MKLKNYYKSTPIKMRKIGDAILLGSTSISGMVMGLPMSDNNKLWMTFGLNIFGVLGKVITNFFTDEKSLDS